MNGVGLILAVNLLGYIGIKNELLYDFKRDKMWFKLQTQNSTVVMGKHTYESMKGPLPKRKNIVISSNPNYKVEEGVLVLSLKQLEEYIQKNKDKEKILIIGGIKLALSTLDLIEFAYLTKIIDFRVGDVGFDIKILEYFRDNFNVTKDYTLEGTDRLTNEKIKIEFNLYIKKKDYVEVQ